MTGRFSLTLTWVAFAVPCHAQMATIAVTHDHPTGLVQPGESVRVACTLSWTGAYMAARIVGDAESEPDVGIAANVGGPFGPGPLIHYGAPIAGSVRGVDVASTPAFAIPPNPAWLRSEGLEFLQFDWTAPQSAGEVAIDWTPHPGFPDALFFETGASFVPTPLPTTYIGTSLTVVPAPPGGACLTIALGAAAFRRARTVRDRTESCDVEANPGSDVLQYSRGAMRCPNRDGPGRPRPRYRPGLARRNGTSDMYPFVVRGLHGRTDCGRRGCDAGRWPRLRQWWRHFSDATGPLRHAD